MASNNTNKLVLKLFGAVVGMFAFGFALVPLYDVFCDVTGLNGKTGTQAYQAVDVEVDTSRTVTVQFIATNNDQMNWAFKPEKTMLKVHPGEAITTSFYAKNPNAKDMIAQAIPSVSPGRAAEFFHKTECFCFNQQPLAAGMETDMPLQFIVDQDLPKDIRTITLSYTIFDVTPDGVAQAK
ncbi:Cytochrome c oxidase assembly protein CtaG [BD1-7 clade bacterium]|uniref:Cytochrome c oxidase assembly protein CtaG n=1 Tax=BD1-7 clade bacterium TaxID=2029982 RepID=A0A5S9MXA8_9GAMM|nr:Cytochrome c oxidase assembly protein CtaG [BD1-7 clade bacterium]CAA0083527.1 Cytochrome c oxidase assembly protein CtaG [BD1-7 clade bacterium]